MDLTYIIVGAIVPFTLIAYQVRPYVMVAIGKNKPRWQEVIERRERHNSPWGYTFVLFSILFYAFAAAGGYCSRQPQYSVVEIVFFSNFVSAGTLLPLSFLALLDAM